MSIQGHPGGGPINAVPQGNSPRMLDEHLTTGLSLYDDFMAGEMGVRQGRADLFPHSRGNHEHSSACTSIRIKSAEEHPMMITTGTVAQRSLLV